MKKIISLCLSLVFMVSLFAACGSKAEFPADTSCEDILNAAQSIGEIPQSEHIYLKKENNLDGFSMSLWADGLYEECKELELLSDYAIFLAAGTKTYEVSVIKAEKAEDTDKLLDLIERRKKTLAAGDKGMYDPDFDAKLESSLLYKDGNFVIFLLTPDNDAAKAEIEKLK